MDTDDWVTCEVKEDEDLVCRLRCHKLDAHRSGLMSFSIHGYKYQQPQVAEYKMDVREYNLSLKPSNVEIEMGSHPIARELSELLMSTRPFLYYYIPSYQNIWYGPENISLPLIKSFMETSLEMPLERLKS